jgi:hypothetical protein
MESEDFKKLSKRDRLKAFALAFKDDPDFQRLPFPEDILEELGIKRERKEYTATQAVNKCFNMTNTEKYTSNTIETIDQTGLSISFPPVPPLAPPISTTETKTQELEGRSSSPLLCVVEGTEPSV